MTDRTWTTFDATMVVEGCPELAGIATDELGDDLVLAAWQHLIDTGVCWQMQGSFGRAAQYLIDEGYCSRA